jgi:hypothetical protein
MARKKTPEELREQARKLMQQAKELESFRILKIGEITRKYMVSDFADLDAFKQEIRSVFEEV